MEIKLVMMMLKIISAEDYGNNLLEKNKHKHIVAHLLQIEILKTLK